MRLHEPLHIYISVNKCNRVQLKGSLMVKLIQRLLRLITLFICLSIYTRIGMKDASNTKCGKHVLQEKKNCRSALLPLVCDHLFLAGRTREHL